MLPLTKILNSKQSVLNNRDPLWVTFVRDYKDVIRENSTILPLDDVLLDRYEHKIHHLLDDNKCGENIHWIALIINDIRAFEEIRTKRFLYIPTENYINTLFSKFKNSLHLR